jgi:hypothetical protein
MAVVGYLILSMNSSTTRNVTRDFINTRANLMMKSATEYAILALHGHDFSKKCLKGVNLKDGFFDVNITYTYFSTDCSKFSGCRCKNIQTADTNGAVLVYVELKSRNPNFKIRKMRFTLQNP